MNPAVCLLESVENSSAAAVELQAVFSIGTSV